MDGDALGGKGMLARPEVGATRNERGILHAAGVRATVGIDHRQRVVRILTVPQTEILEAIKGGPEVAVRDALVIGLEQKGNRHVAKGNLVSGQVEDSGPAR